MACNLPRIAADDALDALATLDEAEREIYRWRQHLQRVEAGGELPVALQARRSASIVAALVGQAVDHTRGAAGRGAGGRATGVNDMHDPAEVAALRLRVADPMTDTPAPDAAEQIAIEGLSPYRRGVIAETMAHLVVAALARAGWLHDPAEVAALRLRVAELTALVRAGESTTEELRDALDAARDVPGIQRIVTPEMQEALATALEEAATRVRQSIPAGFKWDVEDDLDWIGVGPAERIPGMRSPLRRRFDIEW